MALKFSCDTLEPSTSSKKTARAGAMGDVSAGEGGKPRAYPIDTAEEDKRYDAGAMGDVFEEGRARATRG
jgi:hypothetical protein